MAAPSPSDPQAAVLLVFLSRAEGECLLLLKRPDHPSDPYSGQICLPGGRREAGDASLLECALRETHEEVGIPPSSLEVFAELDGHETKLLQRVKPFAARLRTPCPLLPNPAEVERLLFLPVEWLTPELFQLKGIWRGPDGAGRRIYTFDLDGHEVWGLTARILFDWTTRRPRRR